MAGKRTLPRILHKQQVYPWRMPCFPPRFQWLAICFPDQVWYQEKYLPSFGSQTSARLSYFLDLIQCFSSFVPLALQTVWLLLPCNTEIKHMSNVSGCQGVSEPRNVVFVFSYSTLLLSPLDLHTVICYSLKIARHVLPCAANSFHLELRVFKVLAISWNSK